MTNRERQLLLDLNGLRMDLEAIYQYHELAHETRFELQCIVRRLTKIATEAQCIAVKGESK